MLFILGTVGICVLNASEMQETTYRHEDQYGAQRLELTDGFVFVLFVLLMLFVVKKSGEMGDMSNYERIDN